MPDRRILITGGAGYVGSHTCKVLAKSGYLPIVFDNLSRGHEEHVRWGPLVVGDILDVDALRRAIDKHRPIAVMHFAALAYVAESFSDPLLYYRLNVGGIANVLEAMNRSDCRNLVFSSSCATYGTPLRTPIREGDPQHPISPYGASKLHAERVITDVGNAFGIRSVSLRYFNAAGDDPDLEIGEWHLPEPHAIPLAIRAALDSTNDFCILGGDHPTPDGTAVRDYVHVLDLAGGHVRALEYLLGGGLSTAFNLGSERGTSVTELLDAVERCTGHRIRRSVGPRRVGDPPIAVADSVTARDQLGWNPTYTSIESIVETAVRWHSHARYTL